MNHYKANPFRRLYFAFIKSYTWSWRCNKKTPPPKVFKP